MQPTLSLGAPTPLYEYRQGVVYRVGLRRRVELPELGGAVDLPTWLHGLGRVLSRQLGADQFDIDAAGVADGFVLVTVRCAPVAVGRRARGGRGGGRSENREQRTENRGTI